MVLTWLLIVVSLVGFAFAVMALTRRWTPKGWGGRHREFALTVGSFGFALLTQALARLTEGVLSGVLWLLGLVAFVAAIGGVLLASRRERRQNPGSTP